MRLRRVMLPSPSIAHIYRPYVPGRQDLSPNRQRSRDAQLAVGAGGDDLAVTVSYRRRGQTASVVGRHFDYDPADSGRTTRLSPSTPW